jgi:hypothetical protein
MRHLLRTPRELVRGVTKSVPVFSATLRAIVSAKRKRAYGPGSDGGGANRQLQLSRRARSMVVIGSSSCATQPDEKLPGRHGRCFRRCVRPTMKIF